MGNVSSLLCSSALLWVGVGLGQLPEPKESPFRLKRGKALQTLSSSDGSVSPSRNILHAVPLVPLAF